MHEPSFLHKDYLILISFEFVKVIYSNGGHQKEDASHEGGEGQPV